MEDAKKERCDLTRRHAIHVALGSGLGMVYALLTETGTEAAPRWVAVGKSSQFKEGVPKRVVLPGGAVVFVVRQPKGRWLALSARCTHEGAEVRWDAARKRFVCPLHGATFAASGQDPQGPARRPLNSLVIGTQGSTVRVDASGAPGAGAQRERKEKKEREEEERHEKGERHHGDDDD